MRMAKASSVDIDALVKFMNTVELTMESQKFALFATEKQWLDLDDEDEDKVRMLQIRKELADELGYSEEDVDNRMVIYEYLRELFRPASGWRRVAWGMDILVGCACDPQKDYLDWAPGIEQFHVANEM